MRFCAALDASSHIGLGATVVGKSIQAGKGAVIESGSVLDARDGSILLGPDSRIRSGARILAWGGDIVTGSGTSANAGVVIYGTGGVRIGDNVRIAANAVIVSSSHVISSTRTPIAFQGHTARGIAIEDDVWIGANSTVLDGVVIGRGSVVAAGAVVNRDVAPYSIVGGVPARRIRSRSSPDSCIDVDEPVE